MASEAWREAAQPENTHKRSDVGWDAMAKYCNTQVFYSFCGYTNSNVNICSLLFSCIFLEQETQKPLAHTTSKEKTPEFLTPTLSLGGCSREPEKLAVLRPQKQITSLNQNKQLGDEMSISVGCRELRIT